MNWTSITLADLHDSKVAALVEALDTAALGDAQTGRAASLIQTVVDEIRRKIASCPRNTLDADTTTIPKGLKQMAVELILAALKNALEIALTDDERTSVATHRANLNRIAECKDTIEQPDTAAEPTAQAGGGVTLVSSRDRLTTRTQMGGL